MGWKLKNVIEKMDAAQRINETDFALKAFDYLVKERDDILTALRGLCKQLELVHNSPEYEAIWQMAFVHGMVYKGPTYTEHLAHAKSTLERYGEK